MKSVERNWAGNITYQAQNWHRPVSLEKLQTLVQSANKLKVVGTRHSFNRIADTPFHAIDLSGWSNVVNLDPVKQTVTLEAGMRYGELAIFLDREGFALHNLASLPHISVVGAISTATHGSGIKNGNLASAVRVLEMVLADGTCVSLSPETDATRFAGAVVNLGALGIITKITLSIEPTYDIRQNIYLDLPFSELETNFTQIMSSGYSVSLFTNWNSENINQVWIKRRTQTGDDADYLPTFFGAEPADQAIHPIPDVSPEYCTQQLGISGRWHDRLPHFRLDFTPSRGDELQSEYLLPIDNAVEAINSLNEIRDKIAPTLFISEIRTIAADNLWMSPCYQQACVAFHFTWKPDWDSVKPVVHNIEERLLPLGARPHWGKLFTASAPDIKPQFPKWADFIQLKHELDPQGKFMNPFLEEIL